MRIIGIVGAKQSGKDTVGDMLTQFGYNSIALADPIKAILKIMFLWSDGNFRDSKAKETVDPIWGISPRQAMQSLGTEFGQHGLSGLYPEFKEITGHHLWVRHTLLTILADPNKQDWVVTDVRFPHEFEVLKSQGAKFVCILRDLNLERDDHESEAFWSEMDCDYELHNNGTLDDLYSKVLRLQRMIWE